MCLRETKEACFESIGKEHHQKRNDGIDLGEGIRISRSKQLEGQQADAEIEKPAHNAGYAVPESLTS